MKEFKDLNERQKELFRRLEAIWTADTLSTRYDFVEVMGVLINKYKVRREQNEHKNYGEFA